MVKGLTNIGVDVDVASAPTVDDGSDGPVLEDAAEVCGVERDSRDGPSRPCDGHRRWLVEEQERLQRLVRTIDRTIEGITDGGEMVAEAMFEGFEHNPVRSRGARAVG